MILVLLETQGEKLAKTTLHGISAALQMKQEHGFSKVVGVLLGGSSKSPLCEEAAGYGLDEVLHVQSDVLDTYLALNFEKALKTVLASEAPKAILAASTAVGKDLLPRLAVALDAAQASDVVGILPSGKFRRLMFAGNIVSEIELGTEKAVVTVRPSAFPAAATSGSKCPVRALPVSVEADSRQTFVSFESVKSERPDLSTARIVVSGGRAMQSAENFEKFIAPLADVLGAAIGASRAAVDSGFAPNDWQVGQTGKVVAPDLYVAVGISGAIQHLAGMKDSKVIVAVNKDAEAPIFEVADYGLVADLFQAVPEITAEIQKRKG